jgi:hypothetical protein
MYDFTDFVDFAADMTDFSPKVKCEPPLIVLANGSNASS